MDKGEILLEARTSDVHFGRNWIVKINRELFSQFSKTFKKDLKDSEWIDFGDEVNIEVIKMMVEWVDCRQLEEEGEF